jgi:hypothetical protein
MHRMHRRQVAIGGLCLLAIATWVLNRNNELWAGSTYRVLRGLGSEALQGKPFVKTFPLWGYPGLVAGIGAVSRSAIDVSLPIIQLVACVVVVLGLSYPWLSRWKAWQLVLWLLLMAPVLSFATRRLPDAIVEIALLTMLLAIREWIRTRRWVWLLVGVTSVIVAVNMRSEVLIFVLAAFAATLALRFTRRRIDLSAITRVAGVLAIAALAGVVPWAVNSRAHAGTLLLTSTNGPGWFYEGLGQLPNNPWHLRGYDSYPRRFAATKGVQDPFSLAGSRVLTPEDERLVRAHPMAYLEKVAWNLHSAALGGVEPAPPTRGYSPGATRGARLRALLSLRPSAVSWELDALFLRTRVLNVAFLLASIMSLWIGVRVILWGQKWRPENLAVGWFCFLYTLFEFALVSLGYYMTRFMSPLFAAQVLGLGYLLSAEPLENLVGSVGRRSSRVPREDDASDAPVSDLRRAA